MSIYILLMVTISVIEFWAVVAYTRRKTLNNHPLCRKCQFDLHGLYPGIAACPECGSSLKWSIAVQKGARKPMPAFKWIIGGCIFFTMLLAVLMPLMVVNANAIRFKPVWVLLNEAEGPADWRANQALDELNRRKSLGKLDAAAEARVIQRALAYQGNRARTWRTGWGSFIEDAWVQNQLSAADRERYIQQAFRLRIETPQAVRVGGPCPVEIQMDCRLGHADLFLLGLVNEGTMLSDTAIAMPFRAQVAVPPRRTGTAPWSSLGMESKLSFYNHKIYPSPGLPDVLLIDGEPGQRTLRSRWTLFVLESNGNHPPFTTHGLNMNLFSQRHNPDPDWATPPMTPEEHATSLGKLSNITIQGQPASSLPVLSVRRWEVTKAIEVLPRDAEVIALERDPAIVAAMAARLRKDLAIEQSRYNIFTVRIDPGNSNSAPMSVSAVFQVWAQHNGAEHYLGSIKYKAGDPLILRMPTPQQIQAGLGDGPIDVVFRPDVNRAMMLDLSINRMLGEEIVIQNVPVISREESPSDTP